MKNRVLFVAVILLCLGALLAPGCTSPAPVTKTTPTPAPTSTSSPAPTASPTATAPSIKFRWASYYAAQGNLTVFEGKAISAIKADSKGQMNIDWFPTEQLFKVDEIFNATSDGRLEVGSVSGLVLQGTIPLMEVPAFFGVWKSDDHIRAGIDAVRDAMQSEFAKRGTYLLALTMHAAPGRLFSNVGVPYAPADLKGQIIRVAGKTQGIFIETAGGAPANIAASETYTALQRKTINGVFFSAQPFYDRKLNEVVKYGLDLPLSTPFNATVVNLKWWQGLTDSQRKIIQDDVINVFSKPLQEDNFVQDKAAAERLKKDITIGVPTPAQTAAWVQVGQATNARAIKELGLGATAQNILDIIKKYER